MVSRLKEDLEALGGERVSSKDLSEVASRLSKLERAVSIQHSNLQAAKQKAKDVKEMKGHVNSWLTEKEKELADLERQSVDQTPLDSISVSCCCS